MERDSAESPRARTLLLGLFFGSGLAALVYEVLWLRALRLVFGGGSQATATTLAVFFAGLAAGNFVFGRWAGRTTRPVALYAGLEAAAAIAALLYFLLPIAHVWAYPVLHESLGGAGVGTLAGRVVLSFLFLFPPALLLGGTLPVLAEAFVRRPTELATTTGVLYATNTAGAAVGAVLAGFWLPMLLGLRHAYLGTIVLNLALATLAGLVSLRFESGIQPRGQSQADPEPIALWLGALAFASGFSTLALEVLWTRMLALVLHSSVYAFATILGVFLLSLALGAALSTRLTRHLSRDLHLFATLLGAGLSVGLSPFALHAATGQLGSLPVDWGFGPYILLLLGTASIVVGPPAVLAGAVLPALLRFAESGRRRPGRTVGTLVGINTLGGVGGSLAAGFLLLPWLGLWHSVLGLSLVYLLLALLALDRGRAGAPQLRLAVAAGVLLMVVFLDFDRLALVRTEPDETIERTWETPRGIVAVTQTPRGRRIRLDNTYILGGTEGLAEERLQTEFPMALHGSPKRVFFLGLGTGITAAAALDHDVQRVLATELLPEVVEASREYFAQDAGKLFRDPRASVLAVDGRTHLAATSATWDLIVSDLFVPWQEGAGTLYTREHFEVVSARLEEGGLFAQWLPLFQLTRSEFDSIARTMLEVFADVDFWYVDFRNGEPIGVLIAQTSNISQQPPTLRTRIPEMHYAGNLRESQHVFAGAPLNSDDHPIIEHQAPLSLAAVRSGKASWLTNRALQTLVGDLRAKGDPGPQKPPTGDLDSGATPG